MKKIFVKAALAIAAVTLFASCDLDVFPHDNIAYNENGALFTSSKELTYFRNGLYSSFRGTFYGEYSITEEVMFDGFNATVDYGNNYGASHRLDQNFTSGDYQVRDYWSSRYSAIKDYNIFIKGVNDLPEEYSNLLEEAKKVQGEAYFFRAYAYLQLVRHFAKQYDASTAASDPAVPLVLVYDQQEKPARATVKEVYDQIKADLDAAAAALASVPGEVRSGSVTIDAVNALYARYYLDVKDYSNAATYAKNVINSAAGYALSSSVDEFKNEYYLDKGTEPIMQLFANKTENGSGTNDIFTFMQSDNEHGRYFSSPYFVPSKKLLDKYDTEDLRLKCWFTKGENAFTGEKYYVKLAGDFRAPDMFYSFTKYLGNPDLTNSSVLNSRQMVKPLMIGEMYLIAAEASFRGGNTTDATSFINQLQGARASKVASATEESIANEWFKETVGEGLRQSVIKRFGKGFTGREGQVSLVEAELILSGNYYDTKEVKPDDFRLVWPIPSNEIQTNPNIDQNPGY